MFGVMVTSEPGQVDLATGIGKALARLRTSALAVYGALKGGSVTENEEETVYWCLWDAIEAVEGEVIALMEKQGKKRGRKKKKRPASPKDKPTSGNG